MRVLQLIPTLVVGGAERTAARLAIQLQRRGHEVTVVSLFDPTNSWIEAQLRAAQLPVRFLAKHPGLDLRMIPALARTLAEHRPDVLHTHLYVLKYVLPALARTPRCAVVHTVHNIAEKEVERPLRYLQFVAFRAGVTPVAVGEGVARSMRAVYRLPSPVVIPNGIPVSDFAPAGEDREELRAALGIPTGAPTFVSVAQLRAAKNHGALLRVLASRRLAALGAHLLLAGDGELRRSLEEQARSLGCAARVHFLGERADVPRVLAAGDAFVIASRYEGNPLAVMEAMAAGKPAIAPRVGSLPELVPDATGWLVPPGDDDALEAALFVAASDPELAARKGRASRAFALERFDEGTMANAYERLYGEVAR